jgi:hypothetical protein
MAKAGRRSKEVKHVGFRMPLDLYHEYLAVADTRGLDLTVLFLWALNECRPTLLLRHAKHQAALLHAALVDPQEVADDEDNESDMLVATNDLLRKIEDLATILRKRAVKDEGRQAA